ncbi:MAG: amidohydrolase [Candidatus Helarchaeota archaeon]
MYDVIVLNAVIYPLDNRGNIIEAFAIKKGKIVKIYTKEPGNSNIIAKKTIDMEGKTIIPAFTDSHFHFMATAALKKMAFYVSEFKEGKLVFYDLEEVGKKIKEFADQIPRSRPVLCYNYVISAISEDRLPTRYELDSWCPDRAVVIISMDGHSSAYSTKALRMMNIDPEGHDGILRGEDHEFNMNRLQDIVKKTLSISMLIAGVEEVINDAIQHGIVGLHCLDGFDELKKDLALWFISKFGGIFPIYIRLYPQIRDANRILSIVKRMSYKRIGGCGGWEMDGSISSKTAAFFESYKDDPENFGRCYMSQDQVNHYVKIANELGFQICSHAIGTKAIERILSGYESVLKVEPNNQGQKNPLRHRIEHFEFPTSEQVERAIKKLGLLVSAQPGFSWMDDNFQRAYRKYLTKEQFERQIPLKTIFKLGGFILGSSDSPVQHLNPFIQIHGMVNFPIKKERLDVYQALRTYTYNGAYATFEEDVRGTLTVGKSADFIILDKDPFKIPTDKIIDVKVLKTYLKGNEMKKYGLNTFKLILKYLFCKKRKI